MLNCLNASNLFSNYLIVIFVVVVVVVILELLLQQNFDGSQKRLQS